MPEHRAGVAWVDDPVVVDLAGHEQGVRLALDLLLDGAALGGVGCLVERPSGRLGGLAGDDRHHPGELLRAHHRDLGVGPREQEPWTVGPPAHAVVPGPVGRAHDHREVRHRGVGHGVDHLGAVLDDAGLLVLLADHVAGGVLQEEQRRVGLVGEQDELGGLLRLVHEQHAAGVGQDPTGNPWIEAQPVTRLVP